MSEHASQPTSVSPSRQLMQFIWPGAMAAQAIYVAAKLGLADLLTEGPRSADELALATRAHGPSLRRLLRALTSLGVFAENAAGKFHNTDLSETLRTAHPETMRAWATFLGAPFLWRPWGELYQTVMTGQPAVDRVHGTSFWAYLAEHADDAAVFNAAMTAGSEMSVPWILKAYDFSRFERIVDVGGGHGALLSGILSANPKVRGILYDLPEVVAGAVAVRTGAVAARCEIRAGDFFHAVPAGADAYVLKGIIHDWNDDDALRILKNCRRAIKRDGRLLVIELVLKRSSQPDAGQAFMDVLMLTLVGGRERAESAFRALLREAGFSLTSVIPTAGPSIIESQPL